MNLDEHIAAIAQNLSELRVEQRVAFGCFCAALASVTYDSYCKQKAFGDPELGADFAKLAWKVVAGGEADLTKDLHSRSEQAARQLGEIEDIRAIAAQEACFVFLILIEVLNKDSSSGTVIRMVKLMRDTIDMLVQDELGSETINEGEIEVHPRMQNLFRRFQSAVGILQKTTGPPAQIVGDLQRLISAES
jgi:uncharacterized protein YjaG (DUF416 family)